MHSRRPAIVRVDFEMPREQFFDALLKVLAAFAPVKPRIEVDTAFALDEKQRAFLHARFAPLAPGGLELRGPAP